MASSSALPHLLWRDRALLAAVNRNAFVLHEPSETVPAALTTRLVLPPAAPRFQHGAGVVEFSDGGFSLRDGDAPLLSRGVGGYFLIYRWRWRWRAFFGFMFGFSQIKPKRKAWVFSRTAP